MANFTQGFRALGRSEGQEVTSMAVRPFAFGVRLRDGSRTVRVRTKTGDPDRYVLEDRRSGGRGKRREHATLTTALKDLASTWRSRLH
jgi:hypothetical protein